MEEKLYRKGTMRLYGEIDLLEIVKQLRISKFMSSFLLTQNQIELVKFLKSYTLVTKLPKSRTKTLQNVESNSENESNEKRTHLDDLRDYHPQTDKIDALLHKQILDEDELNDVNSSRLLFL